MFSKRITLALALCTGLAAAANRKDNWKYAGEDHGIRFYYQTAKGRSAGPMMLKLENTLEMPVEVSFRVKDTDWNKGFVKSLAPGESDSTLVYKMQDGASVRYPFIDRVYLEKVGESRDGMLLSLE